MEQSKTPISTSVELENQIETTDTRLTEPHYLSEKVDDGDLALQVLRTHYVPYSAEEERSVLRKIDLRLIPMMVVINGLQFVDKNTISFAATYGIVKETHMKGQEFSTLISIFYIAYLLAQYPTNLLMQKLPTGKYVMVNFILWGVTLAATAGATRFATLAVARFFLGLFEACLFPGFVLLTSSWWKREEQAARTAIWYSANGIFGAPAAAIFWGIAHLHAANMFSYQWMFLIFGLVTVLLAGIVAFTFPDSPVTAKFLNERERLIAVERLRTNHTGIKNTHHKRAQVIEVVTDLKVWLLVLGIFVHNFIGPLQTTFFGVIVKGMGYSTYEAVLLNIPPGVVMASTVLIVGFILSLRWFAQAKTVLIVICYLPGLASCLILLLDPLKESTKSLHYAAVLISVIPAASSGIMYTLLAGNVAGYTKKTVAGAMFFTAHATSSIIAPQTFLQSQAPKYTTGIYVCLAAMSFNILLFIIVRVLYMRENAKRDRDALATETGENATDMAGAFSDLTDKQNKRMRYIL